MKRNSKIIQARFLWRLLANVGPANLPDLLNIRQRSRYNLRGKVGLVSQDPKATIELNSTAL